MAPWQYGASLKLVAHLIPLPWPLKYSEGIMRSGYQSQSNGVARRLPRHEPQYLAGGFLPLVVSWWAACNSTGL